jgi:chromosome segregation ATPase
MKMKTKVLCFAVALAFAPAAFAAYKCVDEKGVTRIGETPPDECANVPMQETRGGHVIRTIPPSLTPEQVKAQQDAAEKTRQAQKEAAEQQRKDLALLNTYASEGEIDMTRDRNVEPISARIKIANERIAAVEKRMKEIEEEMEFYKAGSGKSDKKGKGASKDTPEQLKVDLDRMKKEKVTLEKSIVGYQKEIEQVKAKYDLDRKRWLALKNPQPSK